jgi:hypothetical protein
LKENHQLKTATSDIPDNNIKGTSTQSTGERGMTDHIPDNDVQGTGQQSTRKRRMTDHIPDNHVKGTSPQSTRKRVMNDHDNCKMKKRQKNKGKGSITSIDNEYLRGNSYMEGTEVQRMYWQCIDMATQGHLGFGKPPPTAEPQCREQLKYNYITCDFYNIDCRNVFKQPLSRKEAFQVRDLYNMLHQILEHHGIMT